MAAARQAEAGGGHDSVPGREKRVGAGQREDKGMLQWGNEVCLVVAAMDEDGWLPSSEHAAVVCEL